MNKTIIGLLSVISISTRICEAWADDERIPAKLAGDDLCRLGNFLTYEDKVAVCEIRVEDIQHVPLATSARSQVSVQPRASVLVINRSLLGSGAHRELQTDITLEFEVDKGSELAKECDLILLEKLTHGVFADPFQLQRLQQQDAFKDVHIYGDVDLERPARLSFQSIVEIHAALVEKQAEVLGVVSKPFRAKVSLPLHARYPPTSIDAYFQLNITMPQVLVKCTNREDSSTDHGQGTCIHTFTDAPSQALQWFIPSGSPLHSSLVDGVTTGAALTGVISVFYASKKSSLMNNPRRS